MKPFVGDEYEKARANKCALLVIGESHYLPDKSTIHKYCEKWYSSNNAELTEQEKGWINTGELIRDDINNKYFQKEHNIWKNGYHAIYQYGLGLHYNDEKNSNTAFMKCFEYTVFYNFYLRPANKGNSIKELRQRLDDEIANVFFEQMVNQFSPNGIIFFSRFAYDNCWAKEKFNIPIVATPHPSCCWWNRKSGKYGGRYGREIVQDAMKCMNWEWIRS